MNIFNNLRKYQHTPTALHYSTKTDEVKEDKSLWKKIKEIDWTMPLLTLGTLIISGLVWYIWSVKFCGMVFFGIISFLIFCIFTPGGAHLSLFLEKKYGDKTASWGCLIMLLGPILAATVFISSIDYWDHKKYYEYHGYQGIEVYITPYGECYHNSYNCYTIKGHNIRSISESRALDMGRRPCEFCTSPSYDE